MAFLLLERQGDHERKKTTEVYMDKLQRLRMTIALLLDAEESLAKYQSTLDECGFACVGYKLEIGESKSAIIQRIDVARNALLKLRKEIDKEVD